MCVYIHMCMYVCVCVRISVREPSLLDAASRQVPQSVIEYH